MHILHGVRLLHLLLLLLLHRFLVLLRGHKLHLFLVSLLLPLMHLLRVLLFPLLIFDSPLLSIRLKLDLNLLLLPSVFHLLCVLCPQLCGVPFPHIRIRAHRPLRGGLALGGNLLLIPIQALLSLRRLGLDNLLFRRLRFVLCLQLGPLLLRQVCSLFLQLGSDPFPHIAVRANHSLHRNFLTGLFVPKVFLTVSLSSTLVLLAFHPSLAIRIALRGLLLLMPLLALLPFCLHICGELLQSLFLCVLAPTPLRVTAVVMERLETETFTKITSYTTGQLGCGCCFIIGGPIELGCSCIVESLRSGHGRVGAEGNKRGAKERGAEKEEHVAWGARGLRGGSFDLEL